MGRMFRRALIPAVLALALAACASPTPYQPSWMGDGYGYSEQRIEDNRFRVAFQGSSATPRDTVENYLLYRAAELTLAQGGDYFVVVARGASPAYGYGGGSRVGTTVGVGGGSRGGVGTWMGVGVPLGGTGGGPREASAEIVIHRGVKPDDMPDAFDARAVRKNIGPRILRPGQ